jgi:hypothetical protein
VNFYPFSFSFSFLTLKKTLCHIAWLATINNKFLKNKKKIEKLLKHGNKMHTTFVVGTMACLSPNLLHIRKVNTK